MLRLARSAGGAPKSGTSMEDVRSSEQVVLVILTSVDRVMVDL